MAARRLLTFTDTPPQLMPNDRLAASALAREHGLRRDAEDTPYYAYADGAHWRQGWYEDVRSLTRKLAHERDARLCWTGVLPARLRQRRDRRADVALVG